jgi:outer membrane protein assembly factor BamE (lipoprotein component of BamABCDE complex)
MNPMRLARAALPALAMSLLAACAGGPMAAYAPMGAGGAVRTDATFAHIASGMPESQVAQMLGRPDETMRFPLSNSEAWDYRYYDTWGYMAIFSVTFGPDHRVVSTISNRVNSGGDHAGSK